MTGKEQGDLEQVSVEEKGYMYVNRWQGRNSDKLNIMNRWQWKNRDIFERVTGKEQGDLNKWQGKNWRNFEQVTRK